MRYKADYLFLHCCSQPLTAPQRHKTLSMCSISFIWMRYIADCKSLWKKYLQQLNIIAGDIVFLQTGAWDLHPAKKRLDYIMEHGRDKLQSCLKDIKGKLSSRGAKFVIVTTPPFGNLLVGYHRGHRNNFALTAFNAMVTSAAVNLAIPVHDEFGIILPRCEQHILGSHYIARSPKDNKIRGEVGIISANMML